MDFNLILFFIVIFILLIVVVILFLILVYGRDQVVYKSSNNISLPIISTLELDPYNLTSQLEESHLLYPVFNPSLIYDSRRKEFIGYARASGVNSCSNVSNFRKNDGLSFVYRLRINRYGKILSSQYLPFKINSNNNNLKGLAGLFGISGIEDARIFDHYGVKYGIANVIGSSDLDNGLCNKMVIWKDNNPLETFKVLKSPPFVLPNVRQKNWAPFSYPAVIANNSNNFDNFDTSHISNISNNFDTSNNSNNFDTSKLTKEIYAEYSINPHRIISIDEITGKTYEISSNPEIVSIPKLRGGSPPILVNFNNKYYYLGIAHEKRIHIRYIFYHYFYLFEIEKPFAIKYVSKEFKINDSNPIEFAAGLSYDDQEDDIIISYGVNDCYSRLSRIPLKTLWEFITYDAIFKSE